MADMERRKEVYDRLTRMFTETGFQPKDAPMAYSELTFARCDIEYGCEPESRMFVDKLMLVVERFIEEVVSRRDGLTGNPTVQGGRDAARD